MNYIKALDIKGFKKFKSLHVDFNKNMNIIVGENEAGKSTILEAIKVVLNQQYRNADKSVLFDLFNSDDIKNFRDNPSIANLPRISIKVEFILDSQSNKSAILFTMLAIRVASM